MEKKSVEGRKSGSSLVRRNINGREGANLTDTLHEKLNIYYLTSNCVFNQLTTFWGIQNYKIVVFTWTTFWAKCGPNIRSNLWLKDPQYRKSRGCVFLIEK